MMELRLFACTRAVPPALRLRPSNHRIQFVLFPLVRTSTPSVRSLVLTNKRDSKFVCYNSRTRDTLL